MEVVKFVVDKSPYACWDWQLQEKNLEFLEGIDPMYFKYVSEINIANIDTEDKHRAATALRLTFSHGLETLFALLCSALQAPQCSIGWLLSYNNYQLTSLVEKISLKEPYYTCFKKSPVTWHELAEHVHANLDYEKEKIEWIQKGFGKIWRWFADEFTNANFTFEYNAIKHGLRSIAGGFDLAFGPEKAPGVPAPYEKMQSLGGSDFGSTYFVKEHTIPKNKVNFRPRRHSRNWNPHNLANGLFLISMSIQNIVSWLRIVNGVLPSKCRFEHPVSEDIFELPWKESVGITHSNLDLVMEAIHLKPFSKEDIFECYKR